MRWRASLQARQRASIAQSRQSRVGPNECGQLTDASVVVAVGLHCSCGCNLVSIQHATPFPTTVPDTPCARLLVAYTLFRACSQVDYRSTSVPRTAARNGGTGGTSNQGLACAINSGSFSAADRRRAIQSIQHALIRIYAVNLQLFQIGVPTVCLSACHLGADEVHRRLNRGVLLGIMIRPQRGLTRINVGTSVIFACLVLKWMRGQGPRGIQGQVSNRH